MFQLIVALIATAGFSYVGYEFYKGYVAAAGYHVTTFHRLVLAAEGSATILWARFGTFVTLVVLALSNAADYFNLPGVSQALQAYMTPTTVCLIGAMFTIVSEMARRRTMV